VNLFARDTALAHRAGDRIHSHANLSRRHARIRYGFLVDHDWHFRGRGKEAQGYQRRGQTVKTIIRAAPLKEF